MRPKVASAISMVSIFFIAGISGCFGNEEETPLSSTDLVIVEAESLKAGTWNTITLSTKTDLSVYIPYFIVDPGSNRVANGTILDISVDDRVSLEWLLPPRNEHILLQVGEYGRENWPVRQANESWLMWYERGGLPVVH